MLTKAQLLSIFRQTNALQRGHFELASGLHSGHYFQCAQFLQHPKLAAKVCRELAGRFTSKQSSVVIGPAIGGIVVSYEVGRALGEGIKEFKKAIQGNTDSDDDSGKKK